MAGSATITGKQNYVMAIGHPASEPLAEGAPAVWNADGTALTSPITGADVNLGGSAVQPLQFVGHRNKYPSKLCTAAGTQLKGFSRYPVFIGSADVRAICLSFTNSMLNSTTGEVDNANAVTIESVALESASPAAFQPVYFAGARSKVLAAGAIDVQSDEISALAFGLSRFTRGSLFYVKVIWSVTSAGQQWPAGRNSQENGAQCSWRFDPAVTTAVSTDATGPFTWSGTTPTGETESRGLCPMVLGRFVTGTPKVFLSKGDSILEGTSFPDAPTFVQYALENATSGKYAHGEVTSGGSSQQYFNGPNQKHRAYDKYANVLIDELGTNAPGDAITRYFPEMYTAARSAGIRKIVRTYLLPRTFCALTTTTLTSSGTTCTLTPATGVLPPVGASITVLGATPAAYNGTFVVTRSSGGSFDYTAASAPGSAATGTIYWSDLWRTEANQQNSQDGAQATFNSQMDTYQALGMIDVILPLNSVRGTNFYRWKTDTTGMVSDAFTSNFASGTHPRAPYTATILGNEIMPVLDALTI